MTESFRMVKLLQLTDTHLYADPAGCLLGVNTRESFRAVVAEALEHGPYDLVLVTGDLVHDSSRAGYDALIEGLGAFRAPVHCLAGNHDEAHAFAGNLDRGGVTAPRQVDVGPWRLVLLDSTIPGEEGGHLDDGELQHLNAALAEGDRHVLVCMHHQPLPVGSVWLDTMAIDNGDRLFRAIEGHPRVRGLLWGHIHQEFDRVLNGVRLLASPSTCVQFAVGRRSFQVDNRPPGFRVLELLPDGRIVTRVHRIDAVPAGLDVASGGY